MQQFMVQTFILKNYQSTLKSELILQKLKSISGNKYKAKLYEKYWIEKNNEDEPKKLDSIHSLLRGICKYYIQCSDIEGELVKETKEKINLRDN